MHQLRLVTLDEEGGPPVATEQLFQFLAGDAGKDGRVRNLVSVKMQDRQHGAIGDGIEELVRMPRRGEGSGFRFAIANNAGHDETRIVEHRPE